MSLAGGHTEEMDKAIAAIVERFRRSPEHPSLSFPTRTIRDLLAIEILPKLDLIIAVDSDGGIGPKPQDTVNVPGDTLGRFAVRVPLMEILASGATPVSVVDALGVEMDPTGKEIIKGVRDEVRDAGLDAEAMVTGSTEDNVPTVATGMGVVIIGIVHRDDLRPGKALEGDVVAAVGLPKSAPGDRIHWSDPEIANPQTVQMLAAMTFVHDILPVGSKGIIHEIHELASSAGLQEIIDSSAPIDFNKSAGPSTCVLVALPSERVESLRKSLSCPVTIAGHLETKES